MSQGAFNAWINCVKKDRQGLLATVLEAEGDIEAGNRVFVSDEGNMSGSLGNRQLDDELAALARIKLNQVDPKSEKRTFDMQGKNVTVFIDVHVPSSEVMLFGAGHDAVPVASFARQCGFRVTVVDQREAFANEERFPGARIILARADQLEENVRPGHRTFIVIMNHHLDRDRACLRFALCSEAPYIGLLGPRKRCDRLLKSLREQGVMFSEAALTRLYNPVGLDVGAEGPEEIAVSIVSEIVAVKHGRSGRHLRSTSNASQIQPTGKR